MARAWYFLAISQLFYFLGDVFWLILEVFLKQNPFPSIADAFYLSYYPLIFIAILQFPVRKLYSTDWMKRVIDLLSLVLGGLPIYWNYILGPIILANNGLGFWDQLLAYSYPIGDLILLGAILILFYNRMKELAQAPVVLISLGIMTMVISDSAFSIQSLQGTYTAGGVSDLGFIIQNLLVWSAAIWQIMITRKVVETEKVSMTVLDLMNSLFSYLPLIWLLLLMFMLFDSQARSLPMSFQQVFLFAIAVWGLVLIRQLITYFDLNHSFKKIDEFVNTMKKQANDLEVANAGLEEEMALRVDADREREKIEDRLRYDASHDYLTQLPNRALFLDRLDMALSRLKFNKDMSYSVLILDLDEFKQINDTRGHLVGDDLLVLVADRLRQCLQNNDSVARLGGDEFILLLERQNSENPVNDFCQHILDVFKEPFSVAGDENTYISLSIGVVENLEGYETASDILRDADVAMNHAKEKGKSRYEIFKSDMRTQAIQRVTIETELRNALKNNELFVHYQPVFSLKTNYLKGFEALLRWKNPRLGSVTPAVFIPVAEQSGLILEIGDWVLREACTQLKTWHNRYPLLNQIVMNVNISGRQFVQPDFIERLKEIIEITGINPGCLKLEITETILMDSKQHEADLFNVLREMGILLQIDDFGTGYSSLSYIQHIPVEIIKIDRSFIKELSNGEKYIDLVHAIVRMAHSLNMETTAEGIETWDQKEILSTMGCDYGQGYLLAKPTDPSIIDSYLEGEQRDLNTTPE